jgi:hypothetical protein
MLPDISKLNSNIAQNNELIKQLLAAMTTLNQSVEKLTQQLSKSR